MTNQHIKRTAYSGMIGIASVVASSILRVLVLALLSRLLREDEYSRYVLLFSFVMITAAVSGLGMADAVLRWGATELHNKQGRKLSALIKFSFLLTGASSAIVVMAVFAAGESISLLIGTNISVLDVRLIILALPLIVMTEILASLARAHESILAYYGIKSLVQAMTFMVLAMTLIYWEPTVPMAVLGFIVSYFITVAFGLYFLKYKMGLSFLSIAKSDMRDLDTKTFFWFGIAAASITTLWLLRDRIPVFFMGRMASMADAGVFFNATRLAFLMSTIMAGLNAILAQKVAVLHASKATDELRQVYQSVVRWAIFISLPSALFMMLEPDFVMSMVFGNDGQQAGEMLFWLTLLSLLSLFTGSSRVLLQMSGNSAYELWGILLTVVIMVPVLYWVLPKWGAVGGTVAVGATILLFDIFRMIFAYKRLRIWPIRAVDMMILAGVLTIVLGKHFHFGGSGVFVSIALTIILSLATAWLLATDEDKAMLKDFWRSVRQRGFASR